MNEKKEAYLYSTSKKEQAKNSQAKIPHRVPPSLNIWGPIIRLSISVPMSEA